MAEMYYEKYQTNINGKLKDINPLYFKYYSSIEGAGYSSRIRNLAVITYVKEGYGTFEIYGRSYDVCPGQVFIIPQGVVTTTRASMTEPWKCISVGFEGEYCRDFEKLPPVFDYSSELFDELMELSKFEGRKDLAVASIIMRMYCAWMPEDGYQSENNLESIKQYIESNFMMPLSVEEIAKKHNMDRTYLSKIFKLRYGKSLKEYIVYIRLKEARRLLKHGNNVTETALLCGFNNQSHFSRIFKKYYDCAPKEEKESKHKDSVSHVSARLRARE